MIVGGQTRARASTIIDYHAPFDQGFKLTFCGGGIEVLCNRLPSECKNPISLSIFLTTGIAN